MTAELLKILSGYGQGSVDKIRQNLSSSGSNATGSTSRSLRFEVIDQGAKATLKVVGKPFLLVVETGRKATPQYTKPSESFVNSIREWLAAKGGNQGAAYGIAKSIHQKGTRLWQKGGRQDIVSNVVNDDLIDRISQDLLKNFANEYMVSVVNTFNNGANSN